MYQTREIFMKYTLSLVYPLILLFFTACGDDENSAPKYIPAPAQQVEIQNPEDNASVQPEEPAPSPVVTPHKADIQRDTPIDPDSWGASVELRACYDTQKERLTLEAYVPAGVSDNTKHYQFFLDLDLNPATGYTSSVQNDYFSLKGVDFMIEDGSVYRALSTSEWKWEKVDEYDFAVVKMTTGEYVIQNCGSLAAFGSLLDIDTAESINMAMEPLDTDWNDIDNFVRTQNVSILCQ
jgi:hypothetical protein